MEDGFPLFLVLFRAARARLSRSAVRDLRLKSSKKEKLSPLLSPALLSVTLNSSPSLYLYLFHPLLAPSSWPCLCLLLPPTRTSSTPRTPREARSSRDSIRKQCCEASVGLLPECGRNAQGIAATAATAATMATTTTRRDDFFHTARTRHLSRACDILIKCDDTPRSIQTERVHTPARVAIRLAR